LNPSESRQLLLDLTLEQIPTLENFVPGDNNLELVARLRGMAEPSSFEAVYLWGPTGSGRSHLLAAVAGLADGKRPCRLLHGGEIESDLAIAPGALLIIDDVEELGEAAQGALFRTFNAARLAGLALLLSGSHPPVQLGLREDLRTRISQTLIYAVKALSDDEKSAALQRHALMRGMRLDDGLLQYLLRRGRRDLPSLLAVIEALDQASLERQRPATVPLLREIMQNPLPLDDQ
jgi:DnaA family protein